MIYITWLFSILPAKNKDCNFFRIQLWWDFRVRCKLGFLPEAQKVSF